MQKKFIRDKEQSYADNLLVSEIELQLSKIWKKNRIGIRNRRL